MFGKNKKKKQKEAEAMKAQEEVKVSTSTETPEGATQEASTQQVSNNQNMSQAMNQAGAQPMPQNGYGQQAPNQPQMQQFGGQNVASNMQQRNMGAGPMPQSQQSTMQQGYRQPVQQSPQYGQAQPGCGPQPQQARPQGQGWQTPNPQFQNQGRPMSQPMQNNGWAQPQQPQTHSQGYEQSRPMTQDAQPQKTEDGLQQNQFSFKDFHQRDTQAKQQDFSYGIDPSMSQPKEFKFGGQTPQRQHPVQEQPIHEQNKQPEVQQSQQRMQGWEQPMPRQNVQGPQPQAMQQGYPSRQSRPQSEPVHQSFEQQRPVQPEPVTSVQPKAPEQPRVNAQPSRMFVPGFEPQASRQEQQEQVEQPVAQPVTESTPQPAEVEPVQEPEAEDAYMEVMNNAHTGTKVDYRATPEPAYDEDVYQPEVTPVTHGGKSPYSYAEPKQSVSEKAVQQEQSVHEYGYTNYAQYSEPTVKPVQPQKEVQAPSRDPEPTVQYDEPIQPVPSPTYNDVLKDRDKDRDVKELDLNEFKEVFETEKKTPTPAPQPVQKAAKLERAPDEKGRVFKSKKERERERVAEEERVARERARLAKERAEHPDLDCPKEIEAFLVYDLVKSMNKGNCGMVKARCEMAKSQLEDLVKMGYDLESIFNYITEE